MSADLTRYPTLTYHPDIMEACDLSEFNLEYPYRFYMLGGCLCTVPKKLKFQGWQWNAFVQPLVIQSDYPFSQDSDVNHR